MTTPYIKKTLLYPPRADNAIPPERLSFYEKQGDWWLQLKKNGTNSLIYVSPDKKVTTANRHLQNHKQWELSPATEAIFKTLPGNGWYVINAELLHSKVPGIRDIHYIHDVLVDDGEYLLGTTYAQRYARLQMLFLKEGAVKKDGYYAVDDHTWLARNFTEGFRNIFDSLTKPEDEGIVLKNRLGKLAVRNNNGWTVKSRKPHKNFAF